MSAAINRFKNNMLDATQAGVAFSILHRDKEDFANPSVQEQAHWAYKKLIIDSDTSEQEHTNLAKFFSGMAVSPDIEVAKWARNIIEILALVSPGSVRPLIPVDSVQEWTPELEKAVFEVASAYAGALNDKDQKDPKSL